MKLSALILLALAAFSPLHAELTDAEKAAGWKLLFNGKDLTGWRTFGKQNPPGAGWKVVDGTLTKAAKALGGNIVTTESFTDYELVWEWKIAEKGNNGVKYLIDEKRGGAPGPEYQMLDDKGHPDAKVGGKRQTASLYDIIPPAENKVLKAPGEWNESKIIVKGNHVEHWLNGGKVLSYELGSPELKEAIGKSKFKAAAGFGEKVTGPIMITDHSDEVSFRVIKIKPL
ncbi:DUF1080 domain-containing protein [Luteolibacter sp. SL250]|uniref:3-keto-disaccharide hydrolase n=1 Tax=Luteolibacter sp. SL250 TaxID=2995170 RepID=UPI00226DC1B7|nr:DUF1080 domain-containing protein [Luteolibacter sp. SL250]WAC18543.1 DUF1080 domain-containing protein [Luteolibacter sp. SL250]